jgi:hypothetical protein
MSTCTRSLSRRFALLSVTAVLLTAGASARAEAPSALQLADNTVIAVDASTRDVRITDASPREYPYVGYNAPMNYEKAVRDWAAQRFQLTGGSVNTLRITMREGSIVEKLLPVTTGISGWFKKEQGAEYRGTLDVVVEIVDPNGNTLVSADAKEWASESVREDAKQADRELAWISVIRTTFNNLDKELIPRMRQTMAAYLR